MKGFGGARRFWAIRKAKKGGGGRELERESFKICMLAALHARAAAAPLVDAAHAFLQDRSLAVARNFGLQQAKY